MGHRPDHRHLPTSDRRLAHSCAAVMYAESRDAGAHGGWRGNHVEVLCTSRISRSSDGGESAGHRCGGMGWLLSLALLLPLLFPALLRRVRRVWLWRLRWLWRVWWLRRVRLSRLWRV